MSCWVSHFAAFLLALVLSTTSVWAQATASISGTVRDQSGAVLPGVTDHRHADRHRSDAHLRLQ